MSLYGYAAKHRGFAFVWHPYYSISRGKMQAPGQGMSTTVNKPKETPHRGRLCAIRRFFRFFFNFCCFCTFVNDVRQSREKKKRKVRRSFLGMDEAPWKPTEGVAEGGSQGGAAVRLLPVAFVFESVKANRVLASESDWIVEDSVSFGSPNHCKNRISSNCRSVPGHFYGCVPLCRYAKVYVVGSVCAGYDNTRKKYQTDAFALFARSV